MIIDLEYSKSQKNMFIVKAEDNKIVLSNYNGIEVFAYATLVFNKVDFRKDVIVLSDIFTKKLTLDVDDVKRYFKQEHGERFRIVSTQDQYMRSVPNYKQLVEAYLGCPFEHYTVKYHDVYFIRKRV